MPSRNSFDLSHFCFQAGKIGRLQTLSVIPVLPGDSISININGNTRLAGLRRSLITDAAMDLFAFYVPHRHVYPGRGEDNLWLKLIREGVTSDVTLPTTTLNKTYQCLGQREISGVVPKWRVDPYDRIYNRYFKHPTDEDFSLFGASSNFGPKPSPEPTPQGAMSDSDRYGLACCHDKLVWTTGLDPARSKSKGHDTFDPGSSSTIDLWKFAEQHTVFNNLSQRDFFSTRYRDIIQSVYGSDINHDVEEIPVLLGRKRGYLSGFDIDGTSDGNFGQTSSKAFGNTNLNISRWFAPEHGTIWLMALVRFPTIHTSEQHYLVSQPSPDYLTATGDARIASTQPPQELKVKEIFCGSNSDVKLGYQPYGQWYRMHPNVVHAVYDDLNGFPLLSKLPSNVTKSHYIYPPDYDLVFQSSNMMGHWVTNMHVNCSVLRAFPDAQSGLFV